MENCAKACMTISCRLFPPSTLQKRVKWIDKSLNSAQATQKYGVEQMESDNDSDSAQIIQIGKSSRKIEPAADPKIKVSFFLAFDLEITDRLTNVCHRRK